jgi:hypothetical protein
VEALEEEAVEASAADPADFLIKEITGELPRERAAELAQAKVPALSREDCLLEMINKLL